ncbi:hypothetical protein F5Y01DRAFT_178240 [Xylaria sp. FL0043]|nr:hypothetical protein F5Y01DRAFT_178240 [Xylaria sp. FL0043]
MASWRSSHRELNLIFGFLLFVYDALYYYSHYLTSTSREERTVISRHRGPAWLLSACTALLILRAHLPREYWRRNTKKKHNNACLGTGLERMQGNVDCQTGGSLRLLILLAFSTISFVARHDNICTITILDYRLSKGSHPSSPAEGRRTARSTGTSRPVFSAFGKLRAEKK